MDRIATNDPRIMEIGEQWLDFLEEHYHDLPHIATAISLGQVFMFLLQEYRPPMDELIPVLETVVTTYALVQEIENMRYVN